MTLPGKLILLLALLATLVVTGCATTRPGGPTSAEPGEVAALAAAIRSLGADVDPGEARRAAEVAYAETRRLALAYGITDPPLVHNTKVNLGLRERGLCWHWAVDMDARLRQETFHTLDLHQAIANADNPFRLEHSTLVVSRRGDTLFEGIVLDPWRRGGVLHWAPTAADTKYGWQLAEPVLARRRTPAPAGSDRSLAAHQGEFTPPAAASIHRR